MKKIFTKVMLSGVSAAIIMSMAAISVFAEGEAATDANTGQGGFGSMFLIYGLIFVALFMFVLRPQKKKEKEAKQMQDSIQIGDEVVTIGGILGLVVRKGDDNIVIETGGDRSKLRVMLWAISENKTAKERAAAEKAALKKNRGMVTSSPEKKDDSSGKKKKSKKEEE